MIRREHRCLIDRPNDKKLYLWYTRKAELRQLAGSTGNLAHGPTSHHLPIHWQSARVSSFLLAFSAFSISTEDIIVDMSGSMHRAPRPVQRPHADKWPATRRPQQARRVPEIRERERAVDVRRFVLSPGDL